MKNLEQSLAVVGASIGLGTAQVLRTTGNTISTVARNTGKVLASVGKFFADSTVGTVKAIQTSAQVNVREAKLKLQK